MIICQCAGVSDATVCRLIDSGEACSLADITRLTGAGRCCQPCREELREILYKNPRATHTHPIEPEAASAAA